MAKYRFDEIARECRSTFKGDKTGMPIVGLEHIVPNEMLVKNFEVNTKNTFTKTFKKGQILFGRRRAYQQKAGVATFDGICSGDITVIEAIPEKIEPELLPFIVQNEYFFEHAVKGSAGSLSPRVKWEHLASYEIELPSLEQQRILANKLWVAYRLKESYKKLLAATEEMVKSQCIEMFGTLDEPKVEVKRLIDVVLGSGQYGSNTSATDYQEGMPRYIRITDINDDGSLNDDIKTAEVIDDKYRLVSGDIVFARTGATVGKTYLHEAGDAIYAGYLIKYQMNSELMNPLFMKAFTHSKTYYNWVANSQKIGAQPNISATQYDQMPVLVPSVYNQDAFLKIYQQADKSKFVGFKSQFIEMFGNPVTNDKKWETQPIQEIAPEKPSNDLQEGDVWLLNLDMIEPNTGRVIEKVYVDSKELLSVSPFDEGNVLFSKLRPYLNKVVIPNGKGYATTELLPLRPKGKKLNKTFFSYLLRSDEFVTYANSIATGTKMPRMPLTSLRKFECILPPMEQQQQFVAIAEQADKSKYNEYKS